MDFFEKIPKKYDFGENWCFSGGCTWPPEIGKHGFSPEMDVSGRDKKNLKSGAPNFEKQKNESIFKFHTKMSKYQGNLAMKKKHAYIMESYWNPNIFTKSIFSMVTKFEIFFVFIIS